MTRSGPRIGWELLARILDGSPRTYYYIQDRRRRGIPAEGKRRTT